MSVIGIENVYPENDPILRKRREQEWIKIYNAMPMIIVNQSENKWNLETFKIGI